LKKLFLVGTTAVILYLPWLLCGHLRAFQTASKHNFRQESLTFLETFDNTWKIFAYFLSPTAFAPYISGNPVLFSGSLLLIALFVAALARFFFYNRFDSKKFFFFISLLLTPLILFLPLAIWGMFGANLVEQRYFFPYFGVSLIMLAVLFQCEIPRKLFYSLIALMFIVSAVVTIPTCLSLEKKRSEDFETAFSPFHAKCTSEDIVVWDFRAHYGYLSGFIYRESISPGNGVLVNARQNTSSVSEKIKWREIGAVIVLRNDSKIHTRFQKCLGNEKVLFVKIEKTSVLGMNSGTTIFRVFPAERIRKWLELELALPQSAQ
jgi:hypothetical protein